MERFKLMRFGETVAIASFCKNGFFSLLISGPCVLFRGDIEFNLALDRLICQGFVRVANQAAKATPWISKRSKGVNDRWFPSPPTNLF